MLSKYRSLLHYLAIKKKKVLDLLPKYTQGLERLHPDRITEPFFSSCGPFRHIDNRGAAVWIRDIGFSCGCGSLLGCLLSMYRVLGLTPGIPKNEGSWDTHRLLFEQQGVEMFSQALTGRSTGHQRLDCFVLDETERALLQLMVLQTSCIRGLDGSPLTQVCLSDILHEPYSLFLCEQR